MRVLTQFYHAPHKVFVVLAILFELMHLWVTPPFQAPDEYNHFCRAYQISQGHFMPQQSDHRLGGNIPFEVQAYFDEYMPSTFIARYKLSRAAVCKNQSSRYGAEGGNFKDFPNTSYYSPLSYVPQAFTLFILRSIQAPIGIQYYAGKWVMFLLWLWCMVRVIRYMPFGKWLFMALFLLPGSIYTVNSYSADNVTNCIAFLMIAEVLRVWKGANPISNAWMLRLLLFGVVLAFSKIVYAALLLLVFTIPSSRYVNRKQYLVFVTLLFALTGLCAFVWSNEVNEKFLTYAEYNPNFRNLATLEPLADYDLQKQALLQSPLKLPVILFHALTDDPAFYLKTYIGQFGTYLDTSMSNALFCFVCIGLVLLSFFDTNAHVPGWGLKFRWMFIAFVTYSLVILSQYLTWNPVGSVKVVPIQGRYLVPILPFVFILFMRRSESSPFQKSLIPLFTILLLVFAQVSVVQLLTQRYFSNNSMELISFCENFESPRKNIAGSEVECKAYQKLINSEEQLNGTHSLKLDSSLKAISILTLDTIRRGDFLHIEVWCKGGNGYVQLKGDSGAVCKSVDLRAGPSDFYIKNGWRKIRMVMSDGLECDGQSVRLLLANDSQGTVYFDSLTCVVRRFSSTN